ncbi:cytochrome P450 [Nonomuraea sp. FMUSA5-5]|uniref:Cytochrome P450 n=1 Tax=Nonomuraea composti TaxID=2720023 RepID=A0ABX1AZ00_9ACTN|nr:cytochrome P450 [Nonomuraea sp. FMUSA5-5]NJP88188.1 cytochrome P450 [Nonomuraea sp. FMUSA5-5]
MLNEMLPGYPGLVADPYPAYADLRAAGAPHLVTMRSGLYGWLVTRYDDARAALADPRLSKDPRHAPADWQAAGRGRPLEDRSGLGTHLLTTDPPEHTRLRRVVSGYFTPRRLARLRPGIESAARALAAGLSPGDDLVSGFASPLQSGVIGDVLGVPAGDRTDFRRWTAAVVSSQPGEPDARPTALRALGTYVSGLVEAKRRAPGDDVISAMITAAEEGDRLSGDELLSMIFLLLVAGYETTVGLVALGTYTLLRHPEALELLRERPELIEPAVEELLRHDSPVELATWRFALEPVEIGGVVLPAGQPILVAPAAANRDPRRFPEPDRLDLTRRDNAHLSFGHGPHYCLGALLARLVGRAALAEVVRLPGLALAVPAERLRWRASLTVRGPVALPVTFGPA